jgi:hypothetical protein
MLLIIESILTVTAWRKGWKAWALVPMGVAFTIGFLVGASYGPDVVQDLMVPFILVDLVVVAVLIAMNAYYPFEEVSGPVPQTRPKSSQVIQYPATSTQPRGICR